MEGLLQPLEGLLQPLERLLQPLEGLLPAGAGRPTAAPLFPLDCGAGNG